MNLFFNPQIKIWQVLGERAATFLHGQLTNHIKQLANPPFGWNYNLLLTQKGKILADLHVLARDAKCFLLLIPQTFEEIVISHLKKLSPLSRVEISPIESLKVIHLATGILPSIDDTELLIQTNRIGTKGWDWIMTEDEHHRKWLTENNFKEMTEEEIKHVRIENGVCKVGIDATDENFAQEARLEHALHFDKGCYLGQEIVARLQYRGHVNKLLVGLKLQTPTPVPAGTSISLDGKIVGKITSSIFSPQFNSVLTLGYVPYINAVTGQNFEVGESRISGQITELKTI